MTDERILSRNDTKWPMVGLLGLFLLILVSAAVSADEVPYEPVEVVELGAWRDQGGLGKDLRFDQSPDGERLVLLGYASPHDLRVTDRDLKTLAVLDPPNDNAVVEGMRWSSTGEWVCAWGSADDVDHDLMWVWNGLTYQLSDWLYENFTTPLRQLDSAFFQSHDEILALAGRDENGTSRLLLVETSTSDIRRNIPWEDNATIIRLGTDQMRLVCIDERGTVMGIAGSNWENVDDLGGHDIAPSSDSLGIRTNQPWMVGYEDGSVAIWGGNPAIHERSAYFGPGPIQAISWVFVYRGGDSYYIVGTPGVSGGSTLMTYFYNPDLQPDGPASEPMEYASPVISLVGDSKVEGQVWAGFEDGTLRLFNVTIIPNLPPVITIESPIEWEKYREDFTATGIVTDDHDNIQFVTVIIEGGEGFRADVVGERWTYLVNISNVRRGSVSFHVVTSDGRNETENGTFFVVPWEVGDDDEELPRWFPLIPFTIAIIALTLFYYWRRSNHMKNEGRSQRHS